MWKTLLVTLALGAPLAAAAPAVAVPVTYEDPNGSGASVTISSATLLPGERIEITGEGFTGSGGAGNPLVAIKPNDEDLPWAYGGTDAYDGADDAPIWFEAGGSGTPGAFSGWVDVPDDIAPIGPGTGEHAGQHWLRILSGAFSTGDNPTVPIAFQAFFAIGDRVTLGYQGMSGTHFPAGISVTATGRDFAPSSPVEVELDGAAHPSASITTDAEGAFSSPVSIPAGTSTGAHTLSFTTGSTTSTVAITVTPAPTATVLTPSVKPGALLAVRVANFIGVTGQGQRLAIKVNGGDTVECVDTDDAGGALVTAVVPPGTAEGAATVNLLAGTKCLGPPVTDAPGRAVAPAITVSASAPTASTYAVASVGSPLPVSGSGFAPGEAVAVALDGTPTGTSLTASDMGAVTGNVPFPASTATGRHVVLLTGASGAAATRFEAVPAPGESLSATTFNPGGTLGVTITGWRRGDGTGGQKVAIKIDGGDVLGCITTDTSGSGSGSVTVPAAAALGEHEVRLLAGTSCVNRGPVDDAPARSRAVAFTVIAAPGGGGTPPPSGGGDPPPPGGGDDTPAVKTPTARTAKLKGGRLVLTLRGGSGARTRITVKTARKQRVRGKRVTVTLAKATTRKKAGTLKLRLTKAGRALLRRHKTVKVVIRLDSTGAQAVTKRVTLRR